MKFKIGQTLKEINETNIIDLNNLFITPSQYADKTYYLLIS